MTFRVSLCMCVFVYVCVCVCVYRIKLVKNYTILNNFALKAVSNADNYKYRVPSRTEMVPNKTTCHPLVQHNINTVKSRQSEAIRSCPSVTTRVFTRPRLQSIDTISSIQPEGRFWQEPEPSQTTGMALAHCILGSFLGVVCHCFPPRR